MVRSIVLLCCLLLAGGCDNEETLNESLDGVKPEPVFQGKRLGVWRQELTHDDITTRRRAAKTLGQMGQQAVEAVPQLEAALAKPGEDNVVCFLSAVSIWQLTGEVHRVMPSLLSMLRSDDLDRRYRAALALEIIGPPALAASGTLEGIIERYNKLDYSRLSYDEQLLLATANDALKKINGQDD